MIKKLYKVPIKAYQYISQMLPASCRYYPNCSEYALWQFRFNSPHKAIYQSSLRILRCNQFFAGGIDYPKIDYKVPRLLAIAQYQKVIIIYWIVPEKNYFIIIKQF